MSFVAGGDPIRAKDTNDAALGQAALTTATADAAAITTTETAVDVATGNVTAGYKYAVRWSATWLGSVVADRFLLRIRSGSGVAGSQFAYGVADVRATAGSSAVVRTDITAYFTAASTGAMTITTTMQRDSGTGSIIPKGAGSNPRYLSIEYWSGA